MAFQFSITAIGIMVLQKAINAFGSDTIAAYTAASKVEQFFTQPMATLGIAMATYCGQNLGAGKIRRIQSGVRWSMGINVVAVLSADCWWCWQAPSLWDCSFPVTNRPWSPNPCSIS